VTGVTTKNLYERELGHRPLSQRALHRDGKMEGRMFASFVCSAGWQTINRRMVEWQPSGGPALIAACDHDPDLPFISGHDPDRPIDKAAAELEVQKWCWQA
jgi:hypothetical protein